MDFERYTIEHLVDDFVLPDQPRRRAARLTKLRRRLNSARENLATALHQSEDVIRQVDAALAEQDHQQQRRALKRLRQHIPDELHRRVEELESLAWQVARAGDEPVRPDPDLVGRWIAARVLELGGPPGCSAVSTRAWANSGAMDRGRQSGTPRSTPGSLSSK